MRYLEGMSGSTNQPLTIDEATREQGEAADSDYLEWVAKKLRRGAEDLKKPATRHSEEEVWKALGFEG